MLTLSYSYTVFDSHGTLEIFLENADYDQCLLHSQCFETMGLTVKGWLKLENGYSLLVSRQ